MSNTKQVIAYELNLVEQAKKDPAAFKPLFMKYHLQIYKYVYLRMPSEQDSKEVTSLVFEKALTKLKKFKAQGFPFSSWLYQIARNEIADFYRTKKKEKVSVISEDELANLTSEIQGGTSTQEKENRLQEVLKVLEALDDEQVELIELKCFELRPYKEISEITGLSEANARVNIHRIVQHIKNKLS